MNPYKPEKVWTICVVDKAGLYDVVPATYVRTEAGRRLYAIPRDAAGNQPRFAEGQRFIFLDEREALAECRRLCAEAAARWQRRADELARRLEGKMS